MVKPASALKPTVEQIFEYAELGVVIKNLPYGLPELTAILDSSNYSGNRNALWFNPSLSYQTILQLRFRLIQELQDVFTEELPGFKITEADVVCKKNLEGEAAGLGAFDEGSVDFAVRCAIKAKDDRVDMTAGIKFGYSGITITINSVPGKLDHILAWLEDVPDLEFWTQPPSTLCSPAPNSPRIGRAKFGNPSHPRQG